MSHFFEFSMRSAVSSLPTHTPAVSAPLHSVPAPSLTAPASGATSSSLVTAMPARSVSSSAPTPPSLQPPATMTPFAARMAHSNQMAASQRAALYGSTPPVQPVPLFAIMPSHQQPSPSAPPSTQSRASVAPVAANGGQNVLAASPAQFHAPAAMPPATALPHAPISLPYARDSKTTSSSTLLRSPASFPPLVAPARNTRASSRAIATSTSSSSAAASASAAAPPALAADAWAEMCSEIGLASGRCANPSRECKLPNCLHNLGENNTDGIWSKWPRLLNELGPDPNNYKRQSGQRVGLKNPFNTCFFNTYMQSLNNLPDFCALVFESIAAYDAWLAAASSSSSSSSSSSAAIADRDINIAILRQLRILIAHLQCSERSVFDPAALLILLDLDIREQSDVTDLARQFMPKIEEALMAIDASAGGGNKHFGDRYKRMFCGKYVNRTRCLHDGCTYDQPSAEWSFSELNASVDSRSDKAIWDVIQGFFVGTEQTGSNQVLCPLCGVKRVRRHFSGFGARH
jgi:hypothetical protein